MKLISCVIRPERLGAVKEALFQAGVTGISISRVSGHGGEHEVVEHYRGSSIVLEFRDKVKIEMACSEPFVETTINAILSSARTGQVGDGKIFVQPLEQVIRIRTGERDNAALTPVTADEVQRRARGHVLSAVALVIMAVLFGANAGAQTAQLRHGDSIAVVVPASGTKTTTDSAVAAKAAAAALPKWFDDLAVNAFVSSAYEYNSNRPTTGTSSYRVFDFSDNSFNLDVAELVVQIAATKPNDAGFRVDLATGNSIPQIAKTQDQTAAQFDLQQAFASYIAPIGSGLRFDVGKYVTHLGYEVIEGYDGYNDNYSRSILFGYAIPFTHTGVKASYAFSSKVAAMLEVVNGWDLLRDNNHSKSVGAQLTLTPVSPLTVWLNWIGGPELANDNHTKRNVFDVVTILKASSWLTLGVNGDYGVEDGTSRVSLGSDAIWKGIAGYAVIAATDRFSVGLRGETFHDDGGARLGTDTKAVLSEGTVTPTFRFTNHVVARGEVRFDKANQPILATRGALSDKQTTFGANVIFVY
jgi:nitrogen regulatory protein P-II 1